MIKQYNYNVQHFCLAHSDKVDTKSDNTTYVTLTDRERAESHSSHTGSQVSHTSSHASSGLSQSTSVDSRDIEPCYTALSHVISSSENNLATRTNHDYIKLSDERARSSSDSRVTPTTSPGADPSKVVTTPVYGEMSFKSSFN